MTQPAAVDKETSRAILLPFGNGDIARVTLSFYKAPKGQTRPIDAYVVTECEGDFTGAARRAAEAVYNVAQKQLPRIGQMVVGLDIQGLSPGSAPVTGESGGLTFAVAIAGELFKKKRPVAATGIISSSVNGKIERVDGIEKKLTAAAEAIPIEGRILYPADNHDEIPEKVFKLARDKRITLHPVSTITEAIYEAYDIQVEDNQSKNDLPLKKISPAIILLLSAIALGTAFFMNNDRPESLTPSQSIPATETEPQNITEAPVATPPPVDETARDIHTADIAHSPDVPVAQKPLPQPVLPEPHTEEKTVPQPAPVPEKPTVEPTQTPSKTEEEAPAQPVPTSSEPIYPDSGFE